MLVDMTLSTAQCDKHVIWSGAACEIPPVA